MKSKNSILLTIEQVNENLKKQFPGEVIKCTDITEKEFYIETECMNIVVTEKQLFRMATTGSMADYKLAAQNNNLALVNRQFKYAIYIPFIYIRRLAGSELKEQESKVLIACGLKKEKIQSDIDRLRAIGGKMFVDIYKMVQQLEITKVSFQENERWTKRIVIEHTKGNCAFPIVDCSEAFEGELKGIFLRMMNIAVNKEIMHFPDSISLPTALKMVS